MGTEPIRIIGLVSAILGLLVNLGWDISPELQKSILAVMEQMWPLLFIAMAEGGRGFVSPVGDPPNEDK